MNIYIYIYICIDIHIIYSLHSIIPLILPLVMTMTPFAREGSAVKQIADIVADAEVHCFRLLSEYGGGSRSPLVI